MGKGLKRKYVADGIVQRKNGSFRDVLQKAKFIQEIIQTSRADRRNVKIYYEVKHGLKGKGDNITLDTWFDIWLNTHKKRTIKESTQVRYDDFYRRYIKKQIGKQRGQILTRLFWNVCFRIWQMMITAQRPYGMCTIFSMLCSNMQCITGFLLSIHVQGEYSNKDKTDTGADCGRTTGSIGTRKGENTRKSHTGSTRNGNAWRRTAWAYMG